MRELRDMRAAALAPEAAADEDEAAEAGAALRET
jgi:hypothetical protein